MALKKNSFIFFAHQCSIFFQNSCVRISIVFAVLFALALWEGIKLTCLHLTPLENQKSGQDYKKTFVGLRGKIYDRNGDRYPMAISLPAWQFFLDIEDVKLKESLNRVKREDVVQSLVTNLNLDAKWVRSQFEKGEGARGRRHIKLKVSQDDRVYRALMTDKNICGVGADDLILRKYPQGRRMSHVLGFVNKEGVGSAGLEQYYNTELSGSTGVIEGKKNASRKEIFDRRTTNAPPIPGHDIYLTLDHNIQFHVENVLQKTVEKFQARRGWVIVQKVKTGEILAMANYPDFQPEVYQDVPSSDRWKNYAIASVYEPGSVMKLITVSALLNTGRGTPNSIFKVERNWFYANRRLSDHVSGYINTATALKKSSNVACAKMALILGNETFYRYLKAFNFGSKYGIELPGEEFGILSKPRRWSKISPTRIAIGQGISVTGLQMISAYSTIANDGVMMRPHIVDRIVSSNGETIRRNTPEIIGKPIRPAIARQLQSMLEGVTDSDGTGWRAAVKGYSVAGKTGTAQQVVDGRYSTVNYFASFIGFCPAKNPVFTVLVTIDRPRPQHSGGYVSAPAFSEITAMVARYLEIPPDQPEELEEDETENQIH